MLAEKVYTRTPMIKQATLGLGTVQWGLKYGIANRNGLVSANTVSDILAAARGAGIAILDTAAQYGEAEAVLGANSVAGFKIVTKTPSFRAAGITDEHVRQLVKTFDESLQRLGLSSVYGLLVHHSEDLLAPGGQKLVVAMNKLKDSGKVEKIGVSIYDGSQLDGLLERFTPDLVQTPVSVLDQRLVSSGQLQRLAELDVEVHVRSVLLQGLLLMPPNELPAYFAPIRGLLERWHVAVCDQGMTPTQAALSYVRNIPGVSTVLVGVESLDQLLMCVSDFSVGHRFDARGLACDDPAFVNPAMWRLS